MLTKLATAGLLLGTLGTLGCSTNAEAMGSGLWWRNLPAVPAPTQTTSHTPAPLRSGDWEDGRALGLKNGDTIIDKLRARTVDTEAGCSATGQLEAAVLAVSRAVRPPAHAASDDVVAGFYEGYLDALREGVAQVRADCGTGAYADGEFAATLYGNVLCQVSKVSADALISVTLAPLYAGWSGGSEAVQASCLGTLETTLRACTGGELGTTLELHLEAGCADAALH